MRIWFTRQYDFFSKLGKPVSQQGNEVTRQQKSVLEENVRKDMPNKGTVGVVVLLRELKKAFEGMSQARKGRRESRGAERKTRICVASSW